MAGDVPRPGERVVETNGGNICEFCNDTMMSCVKHKLRTPSLPSYVAMARKCKCRTGKCSECSRCKKFQCRCERHPEDMDCICHGVKCSKCGVCTTPLQMSFLRRVSGGPRLPLCLVTRNANLIQPTHALRSVG